MPKAKTHKASRKRFKISKKKRFLARKAGQNHFNARESSRTTVRKRRDQGSAKVNVKTIEKAIPYFRKR